MCHSLPSKVEAGPAERGAGSLSGLFFGLDPVTKNGTFVPSGLANHFKGMWSVGWVATRFS